MRLLHVAPFFEPDWGRGGMARASAGLARTLTERGHDVTVVTTRPAGTPAEETRDGVRVIRSLLGGVATVVLANFFGYSAGFVLAIVAYALAWPGLSALGTYRLRANVHAAQ